MAEVGVLNLQIHDNSAKAAEGLGRLASALERVRKSVGGGLKLGNVGTQIEKINTAVSGATTGGKVENLSRLASALKEVKEASNGIKTPNLKGIADIGKTSAGSAADRIKKTTDEATEGFTEMKAGIEGTNESTEKMAQSMEQVFYSVKKAKRETKEFFSQYNPKTGNFEPLEGVKSMSDLNAYYAQQDAAREAERVAQAARSAELQKNDPIMAAIRSKTEGTASEMENASAATEQVTQELEKVEQASDHAASGLQRVKEALIGAEEDCGSFKTAISNIIPGLGRLTKELMRTARRMAMRAAIRQFTEGFKEGIENLYFYSKAVGTDFVTSMNNAASSMMYFKNSIGAAVAPAIMALVPVLQTVVNWVITAINYVNQFLALISGRGGWTKALPVAADAFTETAKKAKGAGGAAKEAAKDVKELLADWDELNIIQSETGGGSGGGGGGGGAGATGAEYASMFEEVKGFNKELESFVRNMEDQFGSIWNFVKEIGAAILAWKVSAAFGGIVGALAGLVGAGITLHLVAKTTAAFDNTYLDTGNIGWLLLGALTPAVGGAFAQKLLSQALHGSPIAKLTWPVFMTIASIVDIATLAGRTDVSALDEKSIWMSVKAGLESGAAAGYIAYAVMGKSLVGSLTGGAAVAIGTIGVAIGIKAIAQAAAGGPTEESIKAAAISSALLGTGGFLLAKAAHASTMGALGLGAAVASGTVATLGAGVAIQAIAQASDEGPTEEQVKAAISGSLMAGAGAGVLAKIVGGLTLGGAVAAGAAAILATISAGVGVRAIVQATESGVTMDRIKELAISSAGMGLAGGALAYLGGAAGLAALTFGGGVALATAAVITVGVGIAAAINASKDDITWGENKLTAEDIESFVNQEMFTVDVKTTGKIITEKLIQPSEEQRQTLQTDLTTMLGDWKVIKLGIASEQDYAAMHQDIDTILSDIDTYVQTAKDAGKLTLQFTPTLVGDTEGEQTDWFSSYTKGWDTVDKFASDTGKRLGELITKAEKNALQKGEPELMATLMQQMANLTSAITKGKIDSEAFGNMVLGIGDIDQASFDGIIEKYKEYKDELRTQYTALANEQFVMQGQLVSGLRASLYGPDGKVNLDVKKQLEEAEALYREMGARLVQAVEDSVKTHSATGANFLLDFLKEKYASAIKDLPEIMEGIDIAGYLASAVVQADYESGDTNALAARLDDWLFRFVKDANEELANYLSETGIGQWNVLEDGVRARIREAMEGAFGPELTNEIIKMWEVENPVKEAVESAKTPKVETTAEVDTVVEESVTYETVEESVADATTPEVAGDLPASVSDNLAQTDEIITQHTFPGTGAIDTSATTNATSAMAAQVHSDVVSVINDLMWLNSLSFGYGGMGGFRGGPGAGGAGVVTAQLRATGGMVRSGEMFFANENGSIEMMGKMGNSAVVANNQQIVDGISKGVAMSNSGMESAMNMMVSLMRQFVSKEFTAKVVPSAGLGRNNQLSNEAYSNIVGG